MLLTVPNRTKPEPGAFNSDLGSVKTWINDLPMANIGESAKALYRALSDLNRQDIPQKNRLKALEQFLKPIDYITRNMEKHFVGRTQPLSTNSLGIAYLSREITNALATGYKILVVEQVAEVADTGKNDKKTLITAIFRSIRLLSNVLIKSYQTYETCQPGIWQEIHTLYQYAEKNRLHDINADKDKTSSGTVSSIENSYKQILLLALACPYRLRHGEVALIYNELEEWAAYSEIQPLDENSKTLFSFNIDSDKAPGYHILLDQNAVPKNCRSLDLAGLISKVREKRTSTHDAPSRSEYQLSPDTLRRLMLAWGVLPQRRFRRTRQDSNVVVSAGLQSTHYFVSGEAMFSDEENRASISDTCSSEMNTNPILNFNDISRYVTHDITAQHQEQPAVWEMNHHLDAENQPAILKSHTTAGMPIDTNHQTQAWKMVNVSADGYRLLSNTPETTRVQVGELLGIRENSTEHTFHWRLGVIRWLQRDTDHELQLGVQMLSPDAVAVAVSQKGAAAANKEYTRGLLLPEVDSLQQPATLLLPSPPFKAGTTAIVNCHGKDVQVELTRLVENTGSFAQLQFKALGDTKPVKPSLEETRVDPNDLDDMWGLL